MMQCDVMARYEESDAVVADNRVSVCVSVRGDAAVSASVQVFQEDRALSRHRNLCALQPDNEMRRVPYLNQPRQEPSDRALCAGPGRVRLVREKFKAGRCDYEQARGRGRGTKWRSGTPCGVLSFRAKGELRTELELGSRQVAPKVPSGNA